MRDRMRRTLNSSNLKLSLAVIVGFWISTLLVASAVAAGKAPDVLDCATMPCAEIMPGAMRFRPVEGQKQWEGLDASGNLVGWVALSTDFVDLKAYSGKPLITIVGLDHDGIGSGSQ